jgi:hypothetical protein
MNKLIPSLDMLVSRLGRVARSARSTATLFALMALLTWAFDPLAQAADATADAGSDSKDMKGVAAPEVEKDQLGSKITGLLNFEFSDKYYTPRGLESSNSGVSFQPLLILFFDLYSNNEDKAPLNDLTFNLGIWNDVDTHANPSERNPGNWDELDGFFGVEAKIFKDWKIDTTETFFRSMTDSYATTTNLDFQVTYMDHWFGDSGFSINPYFGFFYDTSKIPVVLGAPDQYYGTIGMDPTYKFKNIPVTIELPTFVNIVSDSFYEKFDGSAGGAGAAVFSTELKATTPLSFIPISYGKWTAYAGVQYYHLDNPGLEDGNRILKNNPTGTGPADTNLYQFHWGLTCFF